MNKQLVQAKAASVAFSVGSFANAQGHTHLDQVSGAAGIGPVSDLHLVNPWLISRTSGGSSWISDSLTGLRHLFKGTGALPRASLSVRIAAGN
jgi:hypothetical protein